VAGCGACVGCATHDPITCLSGPQIFGSGVLGGAQAELLAVPAADFQLLKIPDGIDTEEALLLTDNLATGWVGAQRADIPPGGTVVVIGLGAVGLCAVRSAIAQGAGTVFAVDLVEGRRERARFSGATPVAPPAAGVIMEATHGRGAASVIDAVGNDASISDALSWVRPGGTVSVVGVHDLQPFPFPALMSLLRSITLRMTTAPVQRTWPELISLIQSGRLDTSGIFTHSMPLDDAAESYVALAARTADCVKIGLTP
jgi:2-desacetyl-2-hydroxyethyl bacteriochlorophyllide A dehydrogenase